MLDTHQDTGIGVCQKTKNKKQKNCGDYQTQFFFCMIVKGINKHDQLDSNNLRSQDTRDVDARRDPKQQPSSTFSCHYPSHSSLQFVLDWFASQQQLDVIDRLFCIR